MEPGSRNAAPARRVPDCAVQALGLSYGQPTVRLNQRARRDNSRPKSTPVKIVKTTHSRQPNPDRNGARIATPMASATATDHGCSQPCFPRALREFLRRGGTQIKTPHDGQGASKEGFDGTIRRSNPQTGHRKGDPSGYGMKLSWQEWPRHRAPALTGRGHGRDILHGRTVSDPGRLRGPDTVPGHVGVGGSLSQMHRLPQHLHPHRLGTRRGHRRCEPTGGPDQRRLIP
jgi:hypothetical protein